MGYGRAGLTIFSLFSLCIYMNLCVVSRPIRPTRAFGLSVRSRLGWDLQLKSKIGKYLGPRSDRKLVAFKN